MCLCLIIVMNVSIVCNNALLQFSIKPIRNCSDLCLVLFSDLCLCMQCSAVQCSAVPPCTPPSLAHDSVHLTVSLLEDGLTGSWAIYCMLGAVRPVLELLEVDRAEEEFTTNNSAINPDTRATKVRHLHLHLQLNMCIHMNMLRFRWPATCELSCWIQRDI